MLQRLLERRHVDQLALTPSAASIIGSLSKELLVAPAREILRAHWQKGGQLLVVGAIGATTRLVAPLLQSKDEDPAVLVLDASGSVVVPLLGGHKAGAENLAMQLAEDLGGEVVLTGDSSSQGRLPLDSFGEAWGWNRTGNSAAWHELMLSQAAGGKLKVQQFTGSLLWQKTDGARKCLVEFERNRSTKASKLFIGSKNTEKCCWHPATLWIGLGCERNTCIELIQSSLKDALSDSGLSKEAIAGLASIDKKDDEQGLIAFSEIECLPIRFFPAESLAEVAVPSPSEIVKDAVGTPSVAEASALLAAGEGARLVRKKTVFHGQSPQRGALTIAIAEAAKPFSPTKGELHLVGSGPGDLSSLTSEARFALSRSVVWIGYGLYLDLLEPLRRTDQVRIDGKLTFERDRCSLALELATQGVRVALISSGDSGIYGMAGLALELWLDKKQSERPKFQVHPGISAFQIAASRVGAPLMNDFCAISLSDLLTPWDKIEDRLYLASKGDFVVAIYNPQSKERDWQLKCAVKIFLECRSPETPVALARQLGRVNEVVKVYTLATLPIKEVDMLTLVLIGNSRSLLKDGWFVTPRGYFSE